MMTIKRFFIQSVTIIIIGLLLNLAVVQAYDYGHSGDEIYINVNGEDKSLQSIIDSNEISVARSKSCSYEECLSGFDENGNPICTYSSPILVSGECVGYPDPADCGKKNSQNCKLRWECENTAGQSFTKVVGVQESIREDMAAHCPGGTISVLLSDNMLPKIPKNGKKSFAVENPEVTTGAGIVAIGATTAAINLGAAAAGVAGAAAAFPGVPAGTTLISLAPTTVPGIPAATPTLLGLGPAGWAAIATVAVVAVIISFAWKRSIKRKIDGEMKNAWLCFRPHMSFPSGDSASFLDTISIPTFTQEDVTRFESGSYNDSLIASDDFESEIVARQGAILDFYQDPNLSNQTIQDVIPLYESVIELYEEHNDEGAFTDQINSYQQRIEQVQTITTDDELREYIESLSDISLNLDNFSEEEQQIIQAETRFYEFVNQYNFNLSTLFQLQETTQELIDEYQLVNQDYYSDEIESMQEIITKIDDAESQSDLDELEELLRVRNE